MVTGSKSIHHVLAADQFNHAQLKTLFAQVNDFRQQLANSQARRELASRHIDKKLCMLFYEPSTRTRLSFAFAAGALGVKVEGTENAREFSSASKGETIEDIVRVLNEYGVDIIVLRHHEAGAAIKAAAVSRAAIINAGDGGGHHPTQAILDLYTIHKELGRTTNLTIALGTDLLHSRTVRSLSCLLGRDKNNRLIFVSPKELRIGKDIKAYLEERGTTYEETDDLEQALRSADVIYWNRIQKERFSGTAPFQKFIIQPDHLATLKPKAIILNPLPRIDEISHGVDSDPRAAYFRQAGNGLLIRMALIDQILG